MDPQQIQVGLGFTHYLTVQFLTTAAYSLFFFQAFTQRLNIHFSFHVEDQKPECYLYNSLSADLVSGAETPSSHLTFSGSFPGEELTGLWGK